MWIPIHGETVFILRRGPSRHCACGCHSTYRHYVSSRHNADYKSYLYYSRIIQSSRFLIMAPGLCFQSMVLLLAYPVFLHVQISNCLNIEKTFKRQQKNSSVTCQTIHQPIFILCCWGQYIKGQTNWTTFFNELPWKKKHQFPGLSRVCYSGCNYL